MIFKYNEGTKSITGIPTWIKSLKNAEANISKLKPQFDKLNAEMQTTGLSAEKAAEQLGGIDDAVIKYCSNTDLAKQSQDGFKASLNQTTLSAKAAEIGMKALAVAGNMIAMWAIGEVISGLYKLSQVSEDVANKAKDLGSSFKQSESSIDDYKTKIEELYDTINNSDSVTEVTNARKELMVIQDELIDKFGIEADAVSYVTDAIKGQTDALDKLTQSQWQNILNDFNESGFINEVANLFGGYKNNIDRMLNEYGNYTTRVNLNSITSIAALPKANDILKQFGDLSYSTAGGLGLEITGTATEVQQKLLEIQNAFNETGVNFGGYFEKELGKAASAAKEISDQYKDMYDQYILYEKIFKDDSYSDMFNNIAEKYNAYQDAFNSGDPEAIEKTTKEYAELLAASLDEAFANGNDEVANYFKNMYPSMQEVVNEWEFKAKIIPTFDTTGIQGKSQSDILKMRQTEGVQDGEEVFDSILASATEYGIVVGNDADRVEQLLNLLGEWGILQKDIADTETPEIEIPDFGSNLAENQDQIEKLTSNINTLKSSLVTLYSGNYSSTDLLSSIQSINESVKEMGGSLDWDFITSQADSLELLGDAIEHISDQYVDSILSDMDIDADSGFGQMLKNVVKDSLEAEAQLESYKDQVSDLTSAYSELTDIVDSYNESGYLTFDQLTSLLEMEPQYLACLVDENGQLSLNQEALLNLANLRLNEAEAQAVAQAITELSTLGLSDEQTAIDNAAQSFSDSVASISAYSDELGRAIVKSSLMTATTNELKSALGGAINRGASKEDIDGIFKNLQTKLNLIDQSRVQLPSNLPGVMGGGKSGSKSKEKKEEKPKEFDWIKTRTEYLEDQHDKFQKILDDETKSYGDQLDALDDLIAKDKERLEFAKRVLEKYNEQWEEARSKLSNEDIANIMEGNDYIGEHKGQYAEDLEKAADIYEKMKDFEDDIEDINQETTDHLREQLKIREEIIKAQQDELKSQMNFAQSRMDLIEAQGGVVTERMLQRQIDLNDDLIDSYNDQINNLYDQIGEVEPNSAAYYSLMAQIDSCESAIMDCRIQQEEWNEKIMRLPVERMQKYLNMLANIKQDLQNFLDQQSAVGINPSVDQLQQLFDISQEEIKSLLEQQDKLKDLLDQYQYGSEKFNDVSQELQDIDNTISGLIQSQKEWNAAMLQIPIDLISKMNDNLSLVGGAIDNILGDYDSVISAVTGTIDKQAESIENLKSVTEDEYKDKIKPFQDELDLLQKQNEERQIQLSLEQAQYDLDKARNQKTNKVIRDGEVMYEADSDAIRTAEKGIADAEYNKILHELETQIAALEEERDKLLEGYDTQIEKLNEIKDRWSAIVEDIKLAADAIKANDVLGQRWEDKILSGKDAEIYELFKGMYENTSDQKAKLDEQVASNERIAEMMNQFVTRYQEGSLSYEQAMAGIKQLSKQMRDGYSSLEQLNALFGLHGVESLESLLQSVQTSANSSVNQFSNYMDIVKANADIMAQYTSNWEEMHQNIKDQIEALKKLAEEAAKVAEQIRESSSSGGGSSGSNNTISNGTIYADGTTTVNNENVEAFYTGSTAPGGGGNDSDNGYVDSGPGTKYHSGLEKGFVGLNSHAERDTTLKLLGLKKLDPDEIAALLKKSEVVLTPEQQMNSLQNLNTAWNYNPSIPDYTSLLSKVKSSEPVINITMGDTILENVSKPDEFAQAMATQFGPLLRQQLSKVR